MTLRKFPNFQDFYFRNLEIFKSLVYHIKQNTFDFEFNEIQNRC